MHVGYNTEKQGGCTSSKKLVLLRRL